MPIEISWDNLSRSIIYTKVIGAWTWEEMYVISEKTIIMRHSVDHAVGAIVDFRAAKGTPDNAFAHTKKILIRQEMYATTTIFVGADFAAKSMWHVFMSVYKSFIKNQDFHFAESLEEARAILAQKEAHRTLLLTSADVSNFKA
jgi:hypothetical protein